MGCCGCFVVCGARCCGGGGAGRGRGAAARGGWCVARRLREPVPAPAAAQSHASPARRAAGTMFHCIVQPRHDWGPPDLTNAHPGTNHRSTRSDNHFECSGMLHLYTVTAIGTPIARIASIPHPTTHREHRYDLLMATKTFTRC